MAQTNSWIGSGSGDWESPQWSLGLPQAGDDIFITNAGSKTIVIEPNTVANYPGTLTVGSITVSSPANSSNSLELNGAGWETPLTTGQLTISDSNSAFYMDGSAFDVSGPLNVNGHFTANNYSIINTAGYDVYENAYAGFYVSGEFDFTDSSLTVPGLEVVTGIVDQNGGTNLAHGVTLPATGTYNMNGGVLKISPAPIMSGYAGIACLNDGTTYHWQGGTFNQSGGFVSSPVNLIFGGYNLNGGILVCGDLTLPTGPPPENFGVASPGFSQSGGTNISGTITLGYPSWGNSYGCGNYNLSGGFLTASNLSISSIIKGDGAGVDFGSSSFVQSGGYFTNAGNITINGIYYPEKFSTNLMLISANYYLSGGILQTVAINTFLGGFNQSGGSNFVDTVNGTYSLSGGWLFAQNINAQFQQTGGTNLVSSITGGIYALSGGYLTRSNLFISGGFLQHSGGQCSASLVTFDGGTWQELTNYLALGQLQLAESTNSIIQFPTNACILTFADSSGLTWSNTGVLTIVNWKGSTNGGGTNILSVGTNANGLTPMQLAQIQFANPNGFAPGYYTARILANGQLVPGDVSYLNAAPGPFFTGEAALGSDWYYLSVSNQVFGYFSLEHFPYVYHADMGWEYFIDAGDAMHGAYFYDFTDGAWIYAQPSSFPYLYDFNQNAWLYYLPSAADRYTSNPRWFYNFSTQTWQNHL